MSTLTVIAEKREPYEIKGYGLSLEIDRLTFRGENHYIFKPTQGVYFEYEKKLLLGIGYANFSPLQDTFYLAENSKQGYATLAYKKYWIIPMYMGKDFHFAVNKYLNLTPGFQVGYTLARVHYELKSDHSDYGRLYMGSKFGFAPRFKAELILSKKFICYINAKYQGLYEITGREGSLSNYHHFFSFGLGATYKIY